MKNTPKLTVLPILTAVAGSIGLGLQFLIRQYAFDDRNLLIPDHPAVTALYILTALTLGLAFLLSRQAKDTQGAFPMTAGSALGAVMILITVALHSARALLAAQDRVTILLAVSGATTVIGFIMDGIRWAKGKLTGGAFYGAASLFLLFYMLYHQQNWDFSAQPARLFFPFVGCIFLITGIFYRAYQVVGAAALQQYLFFHYGAVFFSFCAMPEEPLLFAPFALALLLAPLPEEKPQMDLPENVKLCLNMLKKAGYEAYVVGGCVRDSLLGITPNDYDICTSATPKKIAKIFSKYELVRNGEKHGTIGVVIEGKLYEITTFRTEGGYTDSRHPDWVKFVDSLQEDLARRDFTINAMAYAPDTGYLDPFGGEKDLQDKILRTVGDPSDRFTEDALRILRGVRFASRFQLEPDMATYNAMLTLAGNMESLARERVFSELRGLLPLITREDLIRYAPIITQVIPELKPAIDFQQNSPHHAYDVFTHTAYVVEATPGDLALRFAALLHDAGKPQTYTQDENGRGHFYGHAEVSAKIADDVLLRLKAPTELRQQVVTLIENHMLELSPDKKLLRKRLARFGEDTLKKIISLQEADYSGKGVEEETEPFTQIRAVLREVLEEANCLSIRDLAIDGNDLMQLGIAPGPQMGDILNKLLEMVLDETLENEKTALLQAAETIGGKV